MVCLLFLLILAVVQITIATSDVPTKGSISTFFWVHFSLISRPRQKKGLSQNKRQPLRILL